MKKSDWKYILFNLTKALNVGAFCCSASKDGRYSSDYYCHRKNKIHPIFEIGFQDI